LAALLLYGPWLNFEIGQGNVATDLAAIESLVERHTFFINGSTFEGTIDKFRRADGQLFSQKSPLFHLAGAAVYAPLHAAGFTLRESPHVCLGVLILVFSVVPMGLLLWTMQRHPWLATLGRHERWIPLGWLAIGSLLTPFAVTLNHYVPAALCLLLASAALVRAWPAVAACTFAEGEPTLRPREFCWVGLWGAASLACDIPPAFLALVAVGGALLTSAVGNAGGRAAAWRALLWLCVGAAPLLMAYAALNWRILGSPFPPNMHESAMLYYPGSFWSEMLAAARRGEPNYYMVSYPRRLWHATLGHKGIYWMMPLLIAATAGALWLAGARPEGKRAPGWRLALATAFWPLAGIAVAMRWTLDFGGGAYNLRHVIATTPPLLCVLAHPALAPWRRAGRVGLALAGVWGVAIAVLGVLNPWSHNTLSAWPPLENAAQFCLRHADRMPTEWIGGLIDATSVERWNGWLDYGLALENTRQLPQAEAALARAVRIAPGKALAYYHLGIVQATRHRFAEAGATYAQLQALEPANLGAWNNAGLFALQAGDVARAEACFARSLQLAPENATGLFGRLLLMQARGSANPQAPELRRALQLYPHDPRLKALARSWGAGE
jgi:tetratricopeptide (TPR) repeat protein